MMNVTQELDNDLAAVVEKARLSLVGVRNGHRGGGAGIVWHSDGLILTCAHVVDGQTARVTLPGGRTLPARVLARDTECDLALLAIDAHGLPAIELGDSRTLQPGQWVIALGHPWGINGAISAGSVIGQGAAWGEQQGRQSQGWIVAGLHLRPGHSGGPMVDSEGRLVGINTMINGPDVGVAVPVQAAKDFVRQALASGA